MADGDSLRSNVSFFFRDLAQQVREGVLTKNELIRNGCESLKKSVKKYGDEPINFLHNIATRLYQLNGPLFSSSIDIAEEFVQLRSISSQYNCSKDAINLAIKAVQKTLLLADEGSNFSDIELFLYESYLMNILIAQCDEPLRKPIGKDSTVLSQEEVVLRLDELLEGIEKPIKKMAEQLKRQHSVEKLRMPNLVSEDDVDLDFDLNAPATK